MFNVGKDEVGVSEANAATKAQSARAQRYESRGSWQRLRLQDVFWTEIMCCPSALLEGRTRKGRENGERSAGPGSKWGANQTREPETGKGVSLCI